MTTQNAIRVNHRGFLPDSVKRFYLTENKSGESSFKIVLIDQVEYVTAFEGQLTEKVYSDGQKVWIGDFSALKDDGDYHIEAGGYKSRQFVIYKEAYDICARMMVEYYTYQRCGSALGWNGRCHLDDGITLKSGKRIDLSGGYHQSCDLRKSPAGVAIGVLGMLRYALKDTSEWGKLRVSDEVAWACDYFLKTIQPSGAMYNTLSAPFGWGGRVFYEEPAPSSANWCAAACLALGSRYFKDSDTKRSDDYLDAALRAWDYLTGDKRPRDVYRHPAPHPRGMDPDHFYSQCFYGSVSDECYRAMLAADLFRITGDERFSAALSDAADKIAKASVGGEIPHILWQDTSSAKTLQSSGTYAWLPSGINALCDALEVLGDVNGLSQTVDTIANGICSQLDKSYFNIPVAVYSEQDLDSYCGHPEPGEKPKTYRDVLTDITVEFELERHGKAVPFYIKKKQPVAVSPSTASNLGVFLCRASRLLGKNKYLAYAQSMLDLILGANPLDSSTVRGIGYNPPQHQAFGQFFPSTPYIPGAIGVPYATIDTYEQSSEYDMPCVGGALQLLSELI